MIYKKQYGHPFDTESVVGSFAPAMETIPYLTREPDGFSYAMDPQDILYGLGENIRGINKRGWVYESKCSDDPNHTENKSSLYGAYNFMIVSGKATFGFFIDYPGKVTFDCGYTDLDTLRVTVVEENYDLYIIEGESPTDIVHQFRQLVGRSYIPPKWAFGATQSRWSYMNEDEVREVVANYRTNNMPLDAVVLDIDYMERYKDFTVDEQRFPHFADFAAEMKAQGIRLVPIIDAGVKIEDGYDVYEEGVKNGYFCTNQDGTPFVAGVWPGRVHFPDMLNPEARAWFGSKYKILLNQGIEGFWNDMNEPAIFYSEETLKKTEERLDLINHLKTKYGDTIEKIQAYCEEKKQRFAVLENYEGYLAERKSRFAACKKQLQKEAENLTVIRKEAAQRFTEQVKQALMDLNFLDVQFELDFRLLEDYMVSGQDEVCFMISTNPGQPLRPVQDTASGGELSRIMLAVKSVMADQEKVETLIFDEIDSGISGRTAQMVSEKLALIAGNHQVICITHLAQIAAMADVHFMIEKKVIENETQTSIRQLDEKESIDELARILGGAKITQMVLDSAKEMRQLAKNARGHGFQNEPE